MAGGGTNEKENLQVLCKSCHLIKTSNEHETGQYIKVNDTESTFNKQTREVFDSSLSQTHAFVEKVYFKEVEEDKIMYTIDINKCRKNIYIMVNIVIVYLLYLIRFNNLKDLLLDLVYIILNLIIICHCVVMGGIIITWFVIVLRITSLN